MHIHRPSLWLPRVWTTLFCISLRPFISQFVQFPNTLHNGVWFLINCITLLNGVLEWWKEHMVKQMDLAHSMLMLHDQHFCCKYCSLPNTSNDIRWSVDIRWYRMDAPIGFFGLKDGIQLRSSTNPNLPIDWDSWGAKDRNKIQNKLCGEVCYPRECVAIKAK